MQSREKFVKTLLTKTSNFKEKYIILLWVIWRKTTGKVLFGVPMQVKLYPKPLPGGSTPECCQYCMAQLHPLECQQSTSGHNPGELTLPLPVTNCQELLSHLWPLEALPLSTWDFDWLALVQDLGIWSQSLWVYCEFVWAMALLYQENSFIAILHYLWLYTHPKHLPQWSMIPAGRESHRDVLFNTFLRLKHSLLQGSSLRRKVNNKIALGSPKNWPISLGRFFPRADEPSCWENWD